MASDLFGNATMRTQYLFQQKETIILKLTIVWTKLDEKHVMAASERLTRESMALELLSCPDAV